MMMQVNQALCAGCGVCEEVCPTGAINLVDQRAEINKALCTQCEVCADACPNGAIAAISEPAQLVPPAVVTAPETQIVSTPTHTVLPVAEPFTHGLTSLAGTALAFLGREVAPRLVDVLANALARRLSTPATSTRTSSSAPPKSPTGMRRGIGRQVRYRGGRTVNGNRKGRR
jgi:Fe-S-cluster-containing hydrogenase component 2